MKDPANAHKKNQRTRQPPKYLLDYDTSYSIIKQSKTKKIKRTKKIVPYIVKTELHTELFLSWLEGVYLFILGKIGVQQTWKNRRFQINLGICDQGLISKRMIKIEQDENEKYVALYHNFHDKEMFPFLVEEPKEYYQQIYKKGEEFFKILCSK